MSYSRLSSLSSILPSYLWSSSLYLCWWTIVKLTQPTIIFALFSSVLAVFLFSSTLAYIPSCNSTKEVKTTPQFDVDLEHHNTSEY